MKVETIETLHCDAGWRNYHFVKLTTEDGIVGWSEFDEGFGSPGVTAVIERMGERVIGNEPMFSSISMGSALGGVPAPGFSDVWVISIQKPVRPDAR